MNYKLNQKEKLELIDIFDENGYDVLDVEQVALILEKEGITYIGTSNDIFDQWCELMDVHFPRMFLDKETIVEEDNDWRYLEGGKYYLNEYRIFEDDYIIGKLHECIEKQ